MRTIFVFLLFTLLLSGGYWYFVIEPSDTPISEPADDHSSLVGKEIPLINFATEHNDDPSKNIYIVSTIPRVALVGNPQIAQNINKTIAVRAELLTQDFLARVASSSNSTFNNFAINFTTATATEIFVAWNIDINSQYASMTVATTSKSFIAFRLEDGALVNQSEIK
jgi:hypothetical protein